MLTKFELPQIYPITDTELSGLNHTEIVEKLAASGARLIQIRDKRLGAGELYRQASDAVIAAKKYGCMVLINDRADIAAATDAAGVHLGQDDLSPLQARKLLGNDKIIGYSTHSVIQAIEAAKLPIDYIAIGPIFPTKTKLDTEPVVGLEGLRAVRKAIGTIPLVAIGGINALNLEEVLRAGADSAAVISAIYGPDSDPAVNFKELSRKCF